MKREIVFAGLATLALVVSAAPADAQFFGDYGYGGWGYNSYTTGPLSCPKRYRSARVASHRGISGFYLVSSPYHMADYRYNCHGSYASTGFGWPVNDWQRRLPMH